MRNAIDTLRRVAGRAHSAEATDGELLERFIADRDEVAFEALVRRHGPMVLGVCRRILGHAQDAEDAFQATFLVLVRKAGSVAPRQVVASWLYSVARQTARKALAGTLRRSSRERSVESVPEPVVLTSEPTGDLAALLDGELAGLPEAYRAAIVLCDLEGHTGRDAARQLGWPEGTLFTRLARGRKLLADRLARRGVGPLGALVLPALPPALVSTTLQAASATVLGPAAASAVVAPAVATLTEGVLQAMISLKLKLVTSSIVVLLLVGAAVAGGQMTTQPGAAKTEAKAPAAAPDMVVAPLLLTDKDAFWLDLSLSSRMIPHPTTNCTACHAVDHHRSNTLSLLLSREATTTAQPWVNRLNLNTQPDPHVERGLRWLMLNQQTQQYQQLERLAETLDRATLLELLRLVERRDAAREAIRGVDEALGKVRQAHKDPQAEVATIDALLKHLQTRKEQLVKPAGPKKP